MKRLLKYLLLAILVPVLLYFVGVLLGMLIQIEPNETTGDKNIEIFLQASDIHTDIVLPVKNEIIYWEEIVSAGHSLSPPLEIRYISFGWGDLGFYKNTPQWEDLTPKTAFKALFLKSPAALHVEFLGELPPAEKTISIKVNSEQYRKLSDFILNSFKTNQKGEIRTIPDLHYNRQDAFFHSKGSLNLFKTCNTWTNNALKSAGLPACLWTPFTEGILYTYR